MAHQAEAATHWDAAYAQGDETRSWFEEQGGLAGDLNRALTAYPCLSAL